MKTIKLILVLLFSIAIASCGGGGGGGGTTTEYPRFAYAANSGSDDISVYTINQTTGALTAGTAVAAGTAPRSIITTGTIQ